MTSEVNAGIQIDPNSPRERSVSRSAIGSLASAGGKVAGTLGGKSVGALLGGAIGSFVGPAGTVAGVAIGQELGGEIGGALVGGAAGDAAKQLADYSMPKQHAESVEALQQKYRELEAEVKELRKGQNATGTGLTGVGQGGQV